MKYFTDFSFALSQHHGGQLRGNNIHNLFWGIFPYSTVHTEILQMGFASATLVKRYPQWINTHGTYMIFNRGYTALSGQCSLNMPRLLAARCKSKPGTIIWARGAKRKTILTLDELPQGTLPLDPLPSELEPTYPPVIQQARANMDKFPLCVVLTRVGGFYEVEYLSLGIFWRICEFLLTNGLSALF